MISSAWLVLFLTIGLVLKKMAIFLKIMVQYMVSDKWISSYGFHSIVLKLCGDLL